MLNIGVRAHDFGRYRLDELEKFVSVFKELGVNSIQLALPKSFEDFKNVKGKLSPGLGSAIEKKLSKAGINVAVLGCYFNMGDPNPDKLRSALENFKDHLRFSKTLGASMVGTETGCFNEEYRYTPLNQTPEAFKIFIDTLKEMVTCGENLGALVAIEGVSKHIINTPQKMKTALDTIKSDNLVVIFDPVNFLTLENAKNHEKIIDEAFELFGDKIAAIHLKDFLIEGNNLLTEEATLGEFNYSYLLKKIKEEKPGIDILLENSTFENVEKTILRLKETYEKI